MLSPSDLNFADQWLYSWAAAATLGAQGAISALLASFGDSTEPDFVAIASVYDRMLAVALLLVGAFIACGVIERVIGGPLGVGWNVIPRTLVAVFFAFCGLGVVQYLGHYAALLATTWSPDFLGVNHQLSVLGAAYLHPGPHTKLTGEGLVGLILTALLTSLMALLVEIELVMRAALILIVTAFIPLVAAMSIWPRLAGAATHLGEFLVGLLLCKFVIATAVYIGFGLAVSGISAAGGSAQADNWLLSGLAVLCIAAFSPVVLVQGLRFTHSAPAALTRSWVATGLSLLPVGSALQTGRRITAGLGGGRVAGVLATQVRKLARGIRR